MGKNQALSSPVVGCGKSRNRKTGSSISVNIDIGVIVTEMKFLENMYVASKAYSQIGCIAAVGVLYQQPFLKTDLQVKDIWI